MSNSVVTNYSQESTRRVDLSFSMEYGEDYKRVEKVLKDLIAADSRILTTPEPFVRLGEMADSSVNITVRLWVNAADYWNVHFDMKEAVYTTFTKEGISIPYDCMNMGHHQTVCRRKSLGIDLSTAHDKTFFKICRLRYCESLFKRTGNLNLFPCGKATGYDDIDTTWQGATDGLEGLAAHDDRPSQSLPPEEFQIGRNMPQELVVASYGIII
jgi:hypothetical protein